MPHILLSTYPAGGGTTQKAGRSSATSAAHARCSAVRTLAILALAIVLLVAAPAPRALAAPPANDSPAGALPFESYKAANGIPHDLEAIAELAEATPDAGVPRCLGRSSFARSAWFRVPAADTPQEMTVEAVGSTLAVVDLAAFVQPENAAAPVTREPNACGGTGAGGADAAEEPTSGVSLRVPAGRSVLIEVGRHGPRRSADAERVLLSLDARPVVPASTAPAGDVADAATPAASLQRATMIRLAGSTITGEDPAEPPCPSFGTVWRRVVPHRSGVELLSVTGRAVSTLAVFSGRRPTGANALDCVDRTGYGQLQMRLRLRRGRPLWIRIGSDHPPSGARAALRFTDGTGAVVVDGGPGGFDPTPGGPGGGLPAACMNSNLARARIAGARIAGSTAALNRLPRFSLAISVRGTPVCDVAVELVGPGGHVYAVAQAVRLRGPRVALRRTRHLTPGRYRLSVMAASDLGVRVPVRTNVQGRLR